MGIMFFPSDYQKPTAEIEKVWVESDVFQEGNIGYRVHVTFSMYDALNIRDNVALYFYYESGKALRDKNNLYCTVDGKVATHSAYSSVYKNSEWGDFTIFIPKKELHLNNKGEPYKLFVDITVSAVIWYNNEELAKKSTQFRYYFNIW